MLTRQFNFEKLTSLLRSPAICNCDLILSNLMDQFLIMLAKKIKLKN